MRHLVRRTRQSSKPHKGEMLLRNLLTSVLLYERVRTTKRRAQLVRPMVERVISISKKKRTDLAIRQINAVVTDKNASRKAIEVFSKRYAERNGGFTTMKAVGSRGGDGAMLVDLSLVDGEEVVLPVEKKEKKKSEKSEVKSEKKAPNSTLQTSAKKSTTKQSAPKKSSTK